MLLDGIVEHLFSLGNLLTNLRQIGELEGRTVFVYQFLNVKSVKKKIVFLYCEVLLGKIEGLLDEIGVCIIHLLIDKVSKSTKSTY